MTPIPNIELNELNNKSIEEWNAHLAQKIGNYGSLGSRPWGEVRLIEFLPGVQVGAQIYVVPKKWLASGTHQRESYRCLTVLEGQNDLLGPYEESLKRSLFGLFLPRQTGTGVRRFKMSTWLGSARLLRKMAHWSATNAPGMTTLWNHLTRQDWLQMYQQLSESHRTRCDIRRIAMYLLDLGTRGVLSDFPTVNTAEQVEETIDVGLTERTIERVRKNQPAPSKSKKIEQSSFEPFSMIFVTEFVKRSLWFIDNLGMQLLDCWEELRRVNARAALLGRRQSHPTTTNERRAVIAEFDWRDMDGRPLTELPWEILLRENGRQIVTNVWPPKDGASINMLVSTLQVFDYSLTSFCTGARSSEVLSGTDGSVSGNQPERFEATTFKLEAEWDGRVRDWPVHPIVQGALKLQIRLAKIVRPENTDHLWVLLNDGSEPAGYPLMNVNEPLVHAVKRLQLEHLTGDSRPHSHRWRHTVAYIIALTVTHAQQTIMDLFGHRNYEMPLVYMLGHPQMAEHVARVADEMAYMIAEEAVLDAESGSAGGPAAEELEAGLAHFKMRRGEDELGAEDLHEAVEILTFNGKQWELVREGVLCTKVLGQFGPCTKNRGAADPGSCRTDCTHRLELARAKAGCQSALDALLAEYSRSVVERLDMVAVNLEGQILANLKRWDDVRSQYLINSEDARRIWNDFERSSKVG